MTPARTANSCVIFVAYFALSVARLKPAAETIPGGSTMVPVPQIEHEDVSADVRAIDDDIETMRNTGWVDDFRTFQSNDPASLRRVRSST